MVEKYLNESNRFRVCLTLVSYENKKKSILLQWNIVKCENVVVLRFIL